MKNVIKSALSVKIALQIAYNVVMEWIDLILIKTANAKKDTMMKIVL